jgi:hypothetical protein
MASGVALLYANAGAKNATIDWLERAYAQHGERSRRAGNVSRDV